uniref:Uncharacterized protein n=1 Tax=Leersia perrieri TaxID=77586 RepID=A0A0D9Y194_9ORYZ
MARRRFLLIVLFYILLVLLLMPMLAEGYTKLNSVEEAADALGALGRFQHLVDVYEERGQVAAAGRIARVLRGCAIGGVIGLLAFIASFSGFDTTEPPAPPPSVRPPAPEEEIDDDVYPGAGIQLVLVLSALVLVTIALRALLRH